MNFDVGQFLVRFWAGLMGGCAALGFVYLVRKAELMDLTPALFCGVVIWGVLIVALERWAGK